jgi:hypothetical protein
MNTAQLEDLLYTLELCESALPFDPLAVHVRRLQTIKEILTETRERKTPARILSFCRTEPKKGPDHKE